MGLAGYYRRFIEGFSKVAHAISSLQKKVIKFEWTVRSLLHFDQKSDGNIVGFSTPPCRMYDTMNFFKRRWIVVGYPTEFQSIG